MLGSLRQRKASGMMGNELRRRKLGKPELEYRPISEWNEFFLNLDPSKERADLLLESMPDNLKRQP